MKYIPLILILLCGCYNENVPSQPSAQVTDIKNTNLEKITFENHDYLLWRSYEYGASLIHSESCNCKTNK